MTEITPIHNFQSMIIAPQGGGKTTLCGTICGDDRFMPAIRLDIDRGTDAISRKAKHLLVGEGRKQTYDFEGWAKGIYTDQSLDKIHTLGIRTFEEFNFCFDVLNDSEDPANIYKSVIFDSASILSDISLEQVVREDMRKDSKRAAANRDRLELQDFGTNLNRFLKLARLMQDWQCHIFVTAQQAWLMEDETKLLSIQSSLPGQLANRFPAMFGNVLYIRVEDSPAGPIRFIQFQQDQYRLAKVRDEDRLLGLRSENDVLSLPLILDKLEGRN